MFVPVQRLARTHIARVRRGDGHRRPMPERDDDLPGTLRRSPPKAQRTWQETHDSAVERYGGGEGAHRTALASLKHSFEKVGDHWEPKAEKGPSDAHSKEGRNSRKKTAGGVDVLGHTKDELYERAKNLGVRGRSSMNKEELG